MHACLRLCFSALILVFLGEATLLADTDAGGGLNGAGTISNRSSIGSPIETAVSSSRSYSINPGQIPVLFSSSVTPPASTISTLSGLALSAGALSPNFSSTTTSYTASVPNTTDSITLTSTATDATSTIKVNGTTVASGSASGAIQLSVGSNVLSIVVTAQDATTRTYTVTLVRASPDLAVDTDVDGIPDWREIELGTNPVSVDSDGNGLSDTYELVYKGDTDAFIPRIGDRIRLDLKELGFQGTYKLVGKLPIGLAFNPLTGIIEGKLTGKPLTSSLTVQVLNGQTVTRSIPLVLPVTAFPLGLTGTWQALIYDNDSGIPRGLLAMTFTSPGRWTASWNAAGATALRSARGSFDLTPSEDKASFTIQFPVKRTLLPFQIQVDVNGAEAALEGQCDLGEVKGFRLARGSELPTVSRAYTMLMDHGNSSGYLTPGGLGWVTGVLSRNGNISLNGQLGDAQAVRSIIRLGANGQAIIWLKPYLNKASFIGGVLSYHATEAIPQTNLSQTESQLIWYRMADTNELSYPQGFAAMPVDVMIHPHTASANVAILSQQLGIDQQTFSTVEWDSAGVENLSSLAALPPTFVMDAGYKLLPKSILGTSMMAWSGAVNARSATFAGTLTSPSILNDMRAGRINVSGIVFPFNEGDQAAGAGLVRIPITSKTGAYRTGRIILRK